MNQRLWIWSIVALVGCQGEPTAAMAEGAQPASGAAQAMRTMTTSGPDDEANSVPEAELPVEFRVLLGHDVPNLERVKLNPPAPTAELVELETAPEAAELSLQYESGARNGLDYSITLQGTGEFTLAVTTYLTAEELGMPKETEGRVDREVVRSLLRQAGAIGFMSVTSESLSATCEERSHHKAVITTSVRFGGGRNTVTHDRNCNLIHTSPLQLELRSFESAIMAATHVSAFLQPFYEKNLPPTIRRRDAPLEDLR